MVLTVLQQTTVETQPTIIMTHLAERQVTMVGILLTTPSILDSKVKMISNKKAPEWGFFLFKK